jgi:7-carboxy-7-deazaguanine synthase
VYAVKEIFYTLQGEGFHAGRPAVFCRFAGCNLWSGREADRASAACNFCDTDFVGVDGDGGGRFETAEALANAIAGGWPALQTGSPFVVFTGGEPLLQLDALLIGALHARGFALAVETNGTITCPDGLDWICVSPKGQAPLLQTHGDELKLVYPQPAVDPADYLQWDFARFSLQPMDGPNLQANIQSAINYCLANPKWQLSLQTHKMIGIR